MKPRTPSSPQRRRLLQDLAQRLAALKRPCPLRVAIDGIGAAGKTTLTDELDLRVQVLGRPVIRASLERATFLIDNSDPVDPQWLLRPG